MLSDRDIYATANLLIRQRGTDATFYACQRADEMLAKGDLDGQAVWRRIIEAIKALGRERPLGATEH